MCAFAIPPCARLELRISTLAEGAKMGLVPASCRRMDSSHRAVDNNGRAFLKEMRDETTAVSLGGGWRRGGPGR
jgi:hypothetical protein